MTTTTTPDLDQVRSEVRDHYAQRAQAAAAAQPASCCGPSSSSSSCGTSSCCSDASVHAAAPATSKTYPSTMPPTCRWCPTT